MRNKILNQGIFTFILLLILSACNSSTSPTPVLVPAPSVSIEVSIPSQPSINLSISKPVSASNTLANKPPENALDGTPLTQWDSGADAPQWIQIDLQNLATVTGIRLTTSQSQAGESVHQVMAGSSLLNMQLVHEFNGVTANNQQLEFTFDPPISNVRYIQILTKKNPSQVSWKDIEVLGILGEAIPTPTPMKEMADVIYTNGQILTMEQDQPTAQAIALKGERILAVGNESDVMEFKGFLTKVIDLQGMTMTPGFIDSHGHRIGDLSLYGSNVSVQDEFDNTLRQGWTSIHELFVTDQRMNELKALNSQNNLPVRVSAYLAVGYGYDYIPWYKNTSYRPLQQISPYLQIAGIKITLDQEWGEKVFFDQAQLNTMVTDATNSGWQVATHSFSPKANDEILNAYEYALNGSSNDQARLRIEHTGVMTDAQVQKMAQLGIIGSVQLINASLWSEDVSFKKYIPAEEVQHSARWRDMLNAGILLIGNTDDPWCCTAWRDGSNRPPDNPTVLQSIYQGVTRNNFRGRQPEAWQVAQVLTVDEALHMMTINGAYAAHQEDMIGSLKAGKFADIVILSANPMTTPIDQIPDIYVVMTMVGGEAKYCATGQEGVCVSSR